MMKNGVRGTTGGRPTTNNLTIGDLNMSHFVEKEVGLGDNCIVLNEDEENEIFKYKFWVFGDDMIESVKIVSYDDVLKFIQTLVNGSDNCIERGQKIYDMNENEWREHVSYFRKCNRQLSDSESDDNKFRQLLIEDYLHVSPEQFEYILNSVVDTFRKRFNKTVELEINENNETIVTVVELTEENSDVYFYDSRIMMM